MTATSNIRLQAQADRNSAQLYSLSGVNTTKAANANARDLEATGLLFAGGSLFKSLLPSGSGQFY